MFDLKDFLLREVPEHHMAPATGHTSERGEVWKDAVDKINGAFKHIMERGKEMSGGADEVKIKADFVEMMDGKLSELRAEIGGMIDDKLAEAFELLNSKLEAEIKARMPETPAPTAPAAPAPNDDPMPDPLGAAKQ